MNAWLTDRVADRLTGVRVTGGGSGQYTCWTRLATSIVREMSGRVMDGRAEQIAGSGQEAVSCATLCTREEGMRRGCFALIFQQLWTPLDRGQQFGLTPGQQI